MAALTEIAHAKINLALHVTGQRADGYHLLDTLVTFTAFGDCITVRPADADGFAMTGPFAHALPEGSGEADNLVLAARGRLRRLLQARGHACPPVHIDLVKALPVASGIGGGSADAAAALRALMRLWSASLPPEALQELALSLGADVPMCLVSRPLIARGIGEALTPVALPPLPVLLVNPLVPVSTPKIFALLTRKDNPPMPEADYASETLGRIAPLRNDLQPPAEQLEPVITGLLAAIEATGARVSRMSGSGATCFGLYDDGEALARAADALSSAHPGWFVAATRTLG